MSKKRKSQPRVAIIMGSKNDWKVLKAAVPVLKKLGLNAEKAIVSAHRTPEKMYLWAKDAADRGVEVIIAGAGGAAHLPGMVASLTPLPVIGVPVKVGALDGLDALLSIQQMPKGVPVATVGVDNAVNAAHLAARILGALDAKVRREVEKHLREQTASIQTQARRFDGPVSPTRKRSPPSRNRP